MIDHFLYAPDSSLRSHSCYCSLDWAPFWNISSNYIILSNISVWSWEHTFTPLVHSLCINKQHFLSLWFKGLWDLKPQNIWAKCFSCIISYLMPIRAKKIRKNKYSILVSQMRIVRQSLSPSPHHSHYQVQEMVRDSLWNSISFPSLTDSGILSQLFKTAKSVLSYVPSKIKRKIIYLTGLLWVSHKVILVKPLE